MSLVSGKNGKKWYGPLVGLLLLSLTVVGSRDAVAQDDAAANDRPQPAAVPLVIVNVASVDRLLGDVRYLFQAAGQDQINQSIDENITAANELKGLDRTKPMGMMVFLLPGIPPQPVLVSYVPVSNIDQLAATIGGGTGQLKKAEGEGEGRYELVGERGTQQVVLKDGYAFIANDADALDRKFLDPVKLTSSLSKRHDIAVTLKLGTVPEAVKTLLLTTVRANFNATMQQRDDEPDGPYQLRKAGQGNVLEFIELLLAEGRQITLGINASKETRNVLVEFALDVRAEGNWAKMLKDIDSSPSYFAPLIDEKAPLSFSLSWAMDKREKGNLLEMLKLAEPQVAGQLQPVAPAVRSLFAALSKTAEKGHADAFFQFRSEAADDMVLFGGLKVQNGQQLSAAVRTVLGQLSSNPEVGEIDVDIDAHAGVSFHRIKAKPRATSDGQVGATAPSVYVGTGRRAVWFARGSEESLKATKSAIDKLGAAKSTVKNRRRGVPFRFVLNMSKWLERMDPERSFSKLARQAFENGRDRLQVEIRPTDNGMRFQLKAEEGFLRLLGMSIGRGITARREARESSE